MLRGYTHSSSILRLAARQAAAAVVDRDRTTELVELYEAIESISLQRVRALEDDAARADVLLTGILAAHVVLARLDVDTSTAKAILPALWSADVSQRLQAERRVALLGEPDDAFVIGVRKLLRATGEHRAPAAGHLVRDVVGSGPARYDRGWYGVHGPALLLARRAERPAAVGMVLGGVEKSVVAATGKLSRGTLDGWLDNRAQLGW